MTKRAQGLGLQQSGNFDRKPIPLRFVLPRIIHLHLVFDIVRRLKAEPKPPKPFTPLSRVGISTLSDFVSPPQSRKTPIKPPPSSVVGRDVPPASAFAAFETGPSARGRPF